MQHIKRQLLQGHLRQSHVRQMGRIKCTTQDANPFQKKDSKRLSQPVLRHQEVLKERSLGRAHRILVLIGP